MQFRDGFRNGGLVRAIVNFGLPWVSCGGDPKTGIDVALSLPVCKVPKLDPDPKDN